MPSERPRTASATASRSRADFPRGSPKVSSPGSLVANRRLYAPPPRSRRYSLIPSASASFNAWTSRTNPAGTPP